PATAPRVRFQIVGIQSDRIAVHPPLPDAEIAPEGLKLGRAGGDGQLHDPGQRHDRASHVEAGEGAVPHGERAGARWRPQPVAAPASSGRARSLPILRVPVASRRPCPLAPPWDAAPPIPPDPPAATAPRLPASISGMVMLKSADGSRSDVTLNAPSARSVSSDAAKVPLPLPS